MSLSGLESFVKEQERLLCESNGKETAKQSCEQSGKDKKTSGKTHGTGGDLHNSLVLVGFVRNVSTEVFLAAPENQHAVTEHHHLGAAKLH